MEEMQECPRSLDYKSDSAAASKFNLLIKFYPFISGFVFGRWEENLGFFEHRILQQWGCLFFALKSYISR